jgi:hypothetical protein
MVYKYKVPESLPNQDLHALLEEKIAEVLKENPNFAFIGSSLVKEAEDDMNGVETLMVTFDDPD